MPGTTDLTIPLGDDALLIIDPYPLADSVNLQIRKGESPLQAAEKWLSREIKADVKLEHHHGDRFTASVDGVRQRELVEVKIRISRKRPPVTKESHMPQPRKEIDDLVEELRSWLPELRPRPYGLPDHPLPSARGSARRRRARRHRLRTDREPRLARTRPARARASRDPEQAGRRGPRPGADSGRGRGSRGDSPSSRKMEPEQGRQRLGE